MAGTIWIADRGFRRSRAGSGRRWFQQSRGMGGADQSDRSKFSSRILHEVKTKIRDRGTVSSRLLILGRRHVRDQYDRHETADAICENRRFDQGNTLQNREVPREVREKSIWNECRCFRADPRAGGNASTVDPGEGKGGSVAGVCG